MKKQPEITAVTRQKIIDAFWEIYKQKPIDKISIGEITSITGNNRGTFYHYFQDVYDVLEQIEDELIKQVFNEVIASLKYNVLDNKMKRDINTLYLITALTFKKHEVKIFTLLGKNGDPKFQSKFKETFRFFIINFWNLPKETEHFDYLIEYIYSAMIGLMTKWYENGNDLTDEEFLKMAQGFVAKGVLGVLQ